MMEIAKTSRGGDMLLYQGYAYTKKRAINGWIRWQCTIQRANGCQGGITTDDPIANPRSFKAHNHAASNSTVEAMKCRSDLKIAAKVNTAVRTAPLVATALQTLSPEAMAEVGTIASMKRDVQRQKSKNRPVEPNSLAAINLQPPWTTSGGQHPVPFLIHDSGPQDPERMIIYATDECLWHLSTATEWYMDGNFKLAPNLFMQLYVIRAKLDDGAISCVYAFLCGKAEHNYHTMFVAIVQKCHTLGLFPAPSAVKVDFEMAVFNAVRHVFGPLVDIDGCFYHLCQNTWRHIQQLGLVALYNADDNIKKVVGMMDGLAFLPVNDLQAGVVVVRNAIPNPLLFPLLQYFLETYVGVYVMNANNQMVHQPPLFPPATWNVYQITLNGGSRTNNICEGWNNSFRVLVGQHHPPLYKCIQALQQDNVLVRTHMAQSRNGTPYHTSVKRGYLIYQQNCMRACQQYQQGRYVNNIHGFLERISHGIRF